MKGKLTLAFSAVISAIVGSICCIGPAVAGIAGLGTSALFLKFAPLRPYLLGVALILIAFGFYRAYFRKPKSEECCEIDVKSKRMKISKFMLWGALTFVLISFALPYYLRVNNEVNYSAQFDHSRIVTFKISGLDCEACAIPIEEVLSECDCQNFVFDYKNQELTFEVRRKAVNIQDMISRIEEIGFKVEKVRLGGQR